MCAVMASASAPPSLTFWRISVSTASNFLLSDCSDSAPSASASGMPALSSVASWRVKTATSCGRTRSKKRLRSISRRNTEPDAPPALSPARGAALPPPLASISRCSVMKTPSLRSTCRSTLGPSASLVPDTVLPAAFRPFQA